MRLENILLGMTDWSQVAPSAHPGASGTATARTCQLGEIQLRCVDYSPGYLADHWCSKGHLVFVVVGDLTIEHENGQPYSLGPNMSYHVSDDSVSPHRVLSMNGATIFVVD
jgi:hypothetical protein